MRAIIQRVNTAEVKIDNQVHSSIKNGLLVLLGINEDDSDEDLKYLASKICGMRIFSDADGKMNLDLSQINGEIMIVSQFTLFASTIKGNRPSFIKAAKPDKAIPLYEKFLSEVSRMLGKPVKSGIFGADMLVTLSNDGPVTVILDSKNKE